jgi:hypothetical protein
LKKKSTTPPGQSEIVDAMLNSLYITWAADGNLLASNTPGSAFSSVNGSIIGDTDGRLLHLYSDTMQNLGVSRLRLASLDEMPLTSVPV